MSVYDVLASLVDQIEDALVGTLVGGVAVNLKIGTDWPPINVLQDVVRTGYVAVNGVNVARGGDCVVAVYDRKVGKDATRWSPSIVDTTNTPATLLSVISNVVIAPGGQATISLSGSPTVGDAVSCGLILPPIGSSPPVTAYQVATPAGVGDTPSTMAAKLAALITADPLMSTWVVASAAGAVITLTNRLGVQLGLASYTGNGGTQDREIARRDRSIQIAMWMPTIDVRSALVQILEQLFANLTINFIPLPSAGPGVVARLLYQSDYDIDDDTLSDIYRHDFLVLIDYPVTTTDQLYAIVAPVPSYQVAKQGAPT